MLIQFSVRFSLQGEFIVDFETRKMSSDSGMSILSETSSRPEEENEGEEDEEVEVIYSRITPYEDEPLAVVGADEDDDDDDDKLY